MLKRRIIMLALLALPLGGLTTHAQEKPKEPSKEEAKPQAKKEDSTPSFADREKLLAHFEAEREVLQAKVEVEERKSSPDPKKLQELHEGYRTIDLGALNALVKYVAENAEAKDVGPARYDVIDLSFRLGHWQAAVDAAASYLALHEKDSDDLKRQASYLRASALTNIEGKESDAVSALEGVANAYGGFLEGDLARRDLLRAYLLADKSADALKLISDIQKLKDVQDNEDALAWAKEQRHIIESVGRKVDEASFIKPDESAMTLAEIAKLGKPFVLWYWDTRDGLSLRTQKDFEALAKANNGQFGVYAISVNKSQAVWKQHVEADKESKLTHLFEGRVDSATLSSRKLGVDRFPLAVLVNSDRSIYRFDVPVRDLKRVTKAWLKLDINKGK
ncbi:MAG: hypothetical protein KDB07_11825 [Planctomycetes bacterium]|nr:hypothetical protein [Planctomycetota bacterium]